MADVETESLFLNASRGDSSAVEALLSRYVGDLRHYVRQHAGHLIMAKESSVDLVQSVCRDVLERLGSERLEYRGEAAFKQWLYQAAVLKIKNRQRYYLARRRTAAREQEFADVVSFDAARVANRPTPSQDAMVKEELAQAQAAFDELPKTYRDIITWAKVEQLSHREIAERLSVSEAHSRVLLSRALARLATLYAS